MDLETKNCQTCGAEFEIETAFFNVAGKIFPMPPKNQCDPCCEAYIDRNRARSSAAPIRARWEDFAPASYHGFSMGLLPESSRIVAEKVFKWAPQPRGIGLAGPSRSGKTFILSELMRRKYEQGWRVKMLGGTEFAYLCGSPDQAERRSMIESCCRTELLFLDDLDKMKMTDRVESDLYHIIETRRRGLLSMFCTVNAKGADLAAMMSDNGGSPIVNRLRYDVCEFYAI